MMRIILACVWLPALFAQPKPMVDVKTVVRDQEITLNGKALKYRSTTGMMPLKNEAGETDAQLFYVAYTVD